MKLVYLLILAPFFITPLIAMAADIKPFWKATIVYDNSAGDPLLKTDWGFSCYLESSKKISFLIVAVAAIFYSLTWPGKAYRLKKSRSLSFPIFIRTISAGWKIC